jgi:hypothetical protein
MSQTRIVNCINCGREFLRKKTRKCCSLECVHSRRVTARGNVRWSEGELEILRKYTGAESLADMVARIQDYQRSHGIRVRSYVCIHQKARAYVGPTNMGYYTKEKIRNTLGVSYARVQSWIKEGDKLPTTEIYANCWKIHLHDFRAWARRNPLRIAGIPADRLNELMGDSKFCKAVAALPRAACGAKPVRNLTTGKVYPSAAEACVKTFRSYGSVYHAASLGKTILGERWEWISREQFAQEVCKDLAS